MDFTQDPITLDFMQRYAVGMYEYVCKINEPFTLYRPKIFIDGNQWCALYGDVLYCPDCVETWKERNGAEYDEQYKDPHHLFAMWWNKQVQTQITDKSNIKAYRRNCVGDFVEVHNG